MPCSLAPNSTVPQLKGIKQIYQHAISKVHNAACALFEHDSNVVFNHKIRKQMSMKDFMNRGTSLEVECRHITDQNIVSEIKDDQYIHRLSNRAKFEKFKSTIFYCTTNVMTITYGVKTTQLSMQS